MKASGERMKIELNWPAMYISIATKIKTGPVHAGWAIFARRV
jgi:hypothetical protein